MNWMRFASLCVLVASTAFAESGALVAPSALPSEVVTKLRLNVETAKQAKPEAFSAIAALRGKLPELDARKRGRLTPVSPIIKQMGEDAFFPLVEQIVFASDRTGLSDAAWMAWRVGIVEALGMLRKPEAAPLLVAVVASGAEEFAIARAGAEALARLGNDEAVTALLQLVEKDPLRHAVLSGMGACRRTAIAHSLAGALAETEGEVAAAVIKSLGEVGNSWAWKTPTAGAPAEELEVRRIAAQALVTAYVARAGELRQAASNALMVVDAAETDVMIGAALARASDADRGALEALRVRFANNPVR